MKKSITVTINYTKTKQGVPCQDMSVTSKGVIGVTEAAYLLAQAITLVIENKAKEDEKR